MKLGLVLSPTVSGLSRAGALGFGPGDVAPVVDALAPSVALTGGSYDVIVMDPAKTTTDTSQASVALTGGSYDVIVMDPAKTTTDTSQASVALTGGSYNAA